MKLITFCHNNHIRLGLVINNQVIDTALHLKNPLTLLEFLQHGAPVFQKLQQLTYNCTADFNLNEVTILAPLTNPRKYLGVGLNYAEHIDETGFDTPKYPTIFNKQSSCIIGHKQAIQLPTTSNKLDYEGELAFVIGKRCRQVPVDKAHQVIAGFMVANDVSVRDWQMHSPTWTVGKSFDTHGPIGPWLVTADEIPNPHALSIKTWVDDELRQNSSTQHMIFNCYELIAYLSQRMTLEVGDIITTGTPSGVGVKMQPRGYLTAGQTVKIEIEAIGTLENYVIESTDNKPLY